MEPDPLLGAAMNRHIVTVAILIAAFALYGVGSTSGATILLLMGGGFELWFWTRVLRLGQPRKIQATRATGIHNQ
jgi:hypothetical protein